MCKTIKAQSGNIFILTDKGRKNTRISNKYNSDYVHKDQYKYRVPEKWINEGYVMEVKE